ncbi:hypothetical protein [Arthrobacter sp. 35W]|uniref:hypothetical protein n=1 Tax=Arthrobacter sp. 35W TaxID=1132441 RepID=UPI0012DDF5C5|nr:hypothetical protein [Arthrobacter sp. 35W]
MSSDYHIPIEKIESFDLDKFKKNSDSEELGPHDRMIKLLGRALGNSVAIVGADGPKVVNNVSMTPEQRLEFKKGLSESEARVRNRFGKVALESL